MMHFLGEAGDALRQRTRSSDGYSRLSSDDELDMLPTLTTYKSAKVVPKRRSTACASFCCVFSLFGIIFLSIIASMLWHNSPYLKTSAEFNDKKTDLVKGVIGAIIMYVVCLGVSIYFLFASTRSTAVVDSPRLED